MHCLTNFTLIEPTISIEPFLNGELNFLFVPNKYFQSIRQKKVQGCELALNKEGKLQEDGLLEEINTNTSKILKQHNSLIANQNFFSLLNLANHFIEKSLFYAELPFRFKMVQVNFFNISPPNIE